MAQISVRVDDAVKHEAEQTFDEIGLSMNDFSQGLRPGKAHSVRADRRPLLFLCQSALSGRHHAGCAQRQGAFCPA